MDVDIDCVYESEMLTYTTNSNVYISHERLTVTCLCLAQQYLACSRHRVLFPLLKRMGVALRCVA